MRCLNFFFVLFIVLGVLQGCAVNSRPANTVIAVTIAEPDRVRFHGKGAGAGMMLTSAMGPMGIAIGVAIDEGIGKEIDKTARGHNVSITEIVETAFYEALKRDATFEHEQLAITVERYGFVTQPGKNDPVTAQLHLVIKIEDGKNPQTLRFPDDFSVAQTATLDDVKRNALIIKQLLEYSAQVLADAFVDQNIG